MMRAAALLMTLAAISSPVFAAEEILPPQDRVSGKSVSGLFEKERPDWRRGTVEILGPGGSAVALGLVVDADQRLVATKASEVTAEKLRARVAGGAMETLTRVGEDRRHDIALLRLSGSNRVDAVTWSTVAPEMGVWVASATGEAVRGVRLGVVSAARREIERNGGVLGVILGRDMPEGAGVLVSEVMKDGGAAAAGIKPGDVISAIEGTPVSTGAELRKLVSERDVGDVIDVMITRGEAGLVKKVKLGHRGVIFAMFSRNQAMSGETSKVKSGFPDVFQHATLVSARAMGGPVFDLEGRVIGMNIARVNRSENYAIPAETVRKVVKALADPKAD